MGIDARFLDRRPPADTQMYVDFRQGSSRDHVLGLNASGFLDTTPASSISSDSSGGFFDMNGSGGSNRFASFQYNVANWTWLNIPVAQPICVACWAKPETYLGGFRAFLSRANNNNNTLIFGLNQNVYSIFARRLGNSAGCEYVTANSVYLDNVWSHFCFTFNSTRPAGSRIKIYLNGTQMATTAPSDSIPADKISSGELNIGANQFYVDSFFGNLTKMQIYYADLQNQDVLDLYNGGR